MISFRVKGSSVIRSFQFPGLTFKRSIDSLAYTLPDVLIAAIAVWSLKILNVTGS